MPNRIYQFKIVLKGITPPIWRRIQVPESYSFWDLHVAIQDAMGWLDCHLHAFRIRRKHARAATVIGIPDDYLITLGSVGKSLLRKHKKRGVTLILLWFERSNVPHGG